MDIHCRFPPFRAFFITRIPASPYLAPPYYLLALLYIKGYWGFAWKAFDIADEIVDVYILERVDYIIVGSADGSFTVWIVTHNEAQIIECALFSKRMLFSNLFIC